MFNQTNFDLHHAAYIARTAKVNRDGWMTEGMASPGALHDRGQRTVRPAHATLLRRDIDRPG